MTESELVSIDKWGVKTIFENDRKSSFTFVSNSNSVGQEDEHNFTNPNISAPNKTAADY